MRSSVVIVLASMFAACGKSAPKPTPPDCSLLDSAWSTSVMPAVTGQNCVSPPPRDLSTSEKLSVAVYHFNIQYVAGGLSGFLDNYERYLLDEKQTEDRIVRVGLEPLLDMLLAHPTFHTDVEMQAYFVEVMAERHPDVLDKLRTLATRGQVDVDSFHYSDQLYVAYPRRDMAVSLDLTRDVFDRACLPLGHSIFTQEGQFARGQLALAQERGYLTSVMAKNLFSYQYSETPFASSVLYSDPSAPDHLVLVGAYPFSQADGPGGPFQLAWLFMDDGEVAFSQGALNPYFGLDWVSDPAKLEEHAMEMEQMEAQGFVHATIAEAAAAMKKRGILPTPLPNVMDGTWQPRDTQNLQRWMGGGGLWRPNERDSDVLAAAWDARSTIMASELVSSGNERLQRGVTGAWRELLLSQVSDSTGWNPFVNEVQYSFTHSAAAKAMAQTVLNCSTTTATPTTNPLNCDNTSDKTLQDLGVSVVTDGRMVTTEVHRCTARGIAQPVYEVSVATQSLADFEPDLDPDEASGLQRNLTMTFTRSGDTVELVSALEDQMRTFTLSDYVFDIISIPLPLGVMSLGDGKWVIQNMKTGRLAATLHRTPDLINQVDFVDNTVSRAVASRRVHVVMPSATSEEALTLARALNLDQPLP